MGGRGEKIGVGIREGSRVGGMGKEYTFGEGREKMKGERGDEIEKERGRE